MGDLVGSAAAILSSSEKRAGDAAHNIANLATPGYRAKRSFESFLHTTAKLSPVIGTIGSRIDLSNGVLSQTGNPTDLALSGDGFFVIRAGDSIAYTRNGQFERDPEGRLADAYGRILQGVGGGDIALGDGDFTVASDGAVFQGGRIIAQIAVAHLDAEDVISGHDGAIETASGVAAPMEAPIVRQGFLESSNVSLGDEMVALMQAVRRAESAQRLINVYDDLMGRAVTTFGQAGR